jgi:hypothetical protein
LGLSGQRQSCARRCQPAAGRALENDIRAAQPDIPVDVGVDMRTRAPAAVTLSACPEIVTEAPVAWTDCPVAVMSTEGASPQELPSVLATGRGHSRNAATMIRMMPTRTGILWRLSDDEGGHGSDLPQGMPQEDILSFAARLLIDPGQPPIPAAIRQVVALARPIASRRQRYASITASTGRRSERGMAGP